jgi:hypothetical protein
VALLWYGSLTQPGQNDMGDYWSGAKHGAQNLCFGREACNQALKYYQKTGDLQGAKNIAAFYCISHDCVHSGQNSAQEFHKTKVLVQLMTAEFLLLLGGSGFYDDAAGGGACSFDPNTPVLLANGKAKPIGELKVGDKVESADPATGSGCAGKLHPHSLP